MSFCVENKGKTLFLLKQASKPVSQRKKRVKLTIFGEEQKQEEQQQNQVIDMQPIQKQVSEM